ncbi:hypothetical protein Pint_12618 [Pistacia integerrima]|uniref:Uncharacterized protein n=1 Tax=Pistacia integerrima TaxID=434235 RepID=A0ACC0Y3L9_9ROSI|nr:hypothetical protein Pint_12618 [Pistacia integerrima]
MFTTENLQRPDSWTNNVAAIWMIIVGGLIIVAAIACCFAKLIRFRGLGVTVPLPDAGLKIVQDYKIDVPIILEKFLQDLATEKPISFTAEQLSSFTNNYSTKLGCGGFGVVYEGQFPNGVKIAVKILNSSSCLNKKMKAQFMNEYARGELAAMIESCGIEEKQREKAERMCMVALWCAQDSPEDRPPMSAVVKMLEGGVAIASPPKPFLYLDSIRMEALKSPCNYKFVSNISSTLFDISKGSARGVDSSWYKGSRLPVLPL